MRSTPQVPPSSSPLPLSRERKRVRVRVAILALFALTLLRCGPPQTHCGDGKVSGAEECDDGNLIDGDGCESTCLPTPSCGDAVVSGEEECDDGNLVDGDGCESTCTRPPCGNGVRQGTEACDDGNQVALDGCEPDCTLTQAGVCGDGAKTGAEACDDGNLSGGDGCEADCTSTGGVVEDCPGASLPPPQGATCEVTPGDGSRLITGIILTPGRVLRGGQVLFDAAGTIGCAACDCSAAAGAATATRVTCPRGVVSPGLINAHDHISFQAPPYATTSTERYEHRHDWRRGNDGHTVVPSGATGTPAQIRWAELRQVMAGTTSIAGSGGQGGLLRNLDKPISGTGASQEGLGVGALGLRYETFPLGDSAGNELTSGCGYPGIDFPSVIPADAAYLPHIGEGIEASARNEFLCLSTAANGGQDLITSRTGLIHGIGLKAVDMTVVAAERASLIWSPRSNVMLYGDTAQVAAYSRMGVNIALGSDWVRSGSMNLLRELRCADSLNASHFDKAFSDDRLWRMATSAAADATQTAAKIGRLSSGKVADISIFRQVGEGTYRTVLEANPEDVVLALRGGKVLYGDQPLVAALTSESCDAITVCGAQKAVCLAETGENYSQLSAANASTYPLFFCGVPTDEPTCVPQRAAGNERNGSTTYLGTPDAGDRDGDGIPDTSDNCPRIFNPVRPMDNGKQADGDSDGLGDVCDICPLTAGSLVCTPPDLNDLDGDKVQNDADNCPADHNPTQLDADSDGKGDACDVCPSPNPGAAPCPTGIYALKRPGSLLVGQKVSLGGALVTAVGQYGYFLQVHEGDTGYLGRYYSGIFVYSPSPTVKAGDRVDIAEATASNFFGQVQLNGVTSATVVSSNNPLPMPTPVSAASIATGGSLARMLEGVVVKVSYVSVTDIAPAPGPGELPPNNEFVVAGSLRVNDYLYLVTPFPAVGEVFASITGVAEFRNGNHKLEPRGIEDVVGGPPTLAGFGPSSSFIREGVSGPTIPAPLSVSIVRPQPSAVMVQLSSSSANLTVPATVTIPQGQLFAPLVLSGVAQDPAVTVTAQLGSGSLTATVRVLGATEAAALSSLEPAQSSASPGGKVTFTVGLDIPPPSATAVSLSLSPAGFGTLPAAVTVLTDQLAQSFELTADAAATGSGTVTAQLGADQRTATVTIQTGANHVVIGELAVQGPGGASDEFVELYNPTSAPVDIGGWKLQYKSATGTSYSDKATVPAGTSIAAHRFFLVTGSGYSGTSAADLALATSLSFAGTTNSGHVRIGKPAMGFTPTDANAVDTVGYGSTANAPEGSPAPGFPATSTSPSTLERKAGAASTAASMETGADVTLGNGHDTDDNSADFVLRGTRQPQNAASPAEP